MNFYSITRLSLEVGPTLARHWPDIDSITTVENKPFCSFEVKSRSSRGFIEVLSRFCAKTKKIAFFICTIQKKALSLQQLWHKMPVCVRGCAHKLL